MQNAMVDICWQRAEVLGNIATLLRRARREGRPVVFVQHDHDDYEQMMPGQRGWRIHHDVAPRPDETVLHKNGADAFDNPALDRDFRSRGVHRIVVAGMATDHCVDAAVRCGLALGYEITVAIMAEHNEAWRTRPAPVPLVVGVRATVRPPSPPGSLTSHDRGTGAVSSGRSCSS